MTKKQRWNYPYFFPKETWVGLGIVTILMLFILNFPYLTTNKFYCKNNPDKCVCELKIFEQHYPDGRVEKVRLPHYIQPDSYLKDTNKCDKFRLKTQAELDIDDCNNNPREDEKCKCEEYGVTEEDLKKHQRELDEQNRIEQKCLNDTQHNRYCGSTIIKVLGSCIKSHPKTDYEKHPEDYVAENISYIYCYPDYCNENFTCLVPNKCEVRHSTFYRNKTECEKGNPDWVEETEYPTAKECIAEGYTKEIDCPKKTICREKTEVEKLMDKDCDWLDFWIKRCETKGCDLYSQKTKWYKLFKDIEIKSDIIYSYLKQAWRQKGC